MPRLETVVSVTAHGVSTGVGRRPRSFVAVRGPAAGEYLQRMVSNDVLALGVGASCDALLLTAKARVIATLRVLRRGDDDFLLLTEPELGDVTRAHLLRMRFAARCDIELEEHRSFVVFGEAVAEGITIPTADYGIPAVEVLDAMLEPTLDDEHLERLRIEAGTPAFGKEIDDRVLPAEAGLLEHAVDFTKGCYPGQEPIARLQYRGHTNRELRVLRIEGDRLPTPEADVMHAGKVVGRITSVARTENGALALAYVRVEVPTDAELSVEGARATMAPPRP
jgi:tRNA-modifying protein YgfZ